MRPIIALVLGGGGSRGFAHVGVLEVLQREQIPIDFIVGTSMGGIVGVLYAMGHSPAQIAEDVRSAMSTSGFNVASLRRNSRKQRLEDQLTQLVGDATFADLKIPVGVTAVDMISGEEVVLDEGPLLPALLATSAVPGVFPLMNMGGMQLADGGVLDSLATHVAYRLGADKVIAVDVDRELNTEEPWNDPISETMGVKLPTNWLNSKVTEGEEERVMPNLVSVLWRSVRIVAWHLHRNRLEDHPPDVYLRPDVEAFGSLDFKDMHGPVDAGIAVAEAHLDAIKALADPDIV